MENYGFTEEQARDLDPSTMSWVAVPLKNSDKEVVAVLYVDCKVKDYLDADKLALIGLAVIGIAYFVGLRTLDQKADSVMPIRIIDPKIGSRAFGSSASSFQKG